MDQLNYENSKGVMEALKFMFSAAEVPYLREINISISAKGLLGKTIFGSINSHFLFSNWF